MSRKWKENDVATVAPIGEKLIPTSWSAWRLRAWRRQAERIADAADALHSLADAELERRAVAMRWQAQCGESLDGLLWEAYALVREASRRVRGQTHFEVQLLAGIALFHGLVTEMQTGEGKTLTAVLPAFLHALSGEGCHIVTANDYLAGRDAAFARPIFERLGMTVGCVDGALERQERSSQYACDVTYGTAREFGFDFLRDCLAEAAGESPVQRGHHFALVDEADSVLIDDARTPLLIAAAPADQDDAAALARWCAAVAPELVSGVDFTLETKQRRASLTNHGCRNLLRRSKPRELAAVDGERLYRQAEQALVALRLLERDRDYVVDDDQVGIVDESTGRVAEGRKWQDGLHQAVEAKEGAMISELTQTAARITVQSYFRRYRRLAGLTGTASDAAGEFRRVYKLPVGVIPTRLPCRRDGLPPRIFVSQTAKREAIADEIQRRTAAGQAVLVGTPSVSASESLSHLLRQRGLVHEVLNCRHHAREAEIVAAAGSAGRITIATNMAGRGTDIRVDDAVLRAGGLHVIATEMHSHARIDRQLIGRTARQGEPGTFQFFLSLEDELFRHECDATAELRRRADAGERGELPTAWLRWFRRAQRSLERRHSAQRRELLRQEQQRDRACRELGLDPLLDAVE
jgi:preprotein translocase subunit SecA